MPGVHVASNLCETARRQWRVPTLWLTIALTADHVGCHHVQTARHPRIAETGLGLIFQSNLFRRRLP